MCKSSGLRRMDKCMKEFLHNLNFYLSYGLETISSCCGHGKYPMTILIKVGSTGVFEMCSGTWIPRKRKFYKKDSKGFYYIPEVQAKRGEKG